MWLLSYLIIINILGIVFMGIDKRRAKAGRWRIPEGTLILIAFLGGSIGIYLGLKIFHHKTRHFKFKVIVPVLLLIQATLIAWLFSNV